MQSAAAPAGPGSALPARLREAFLFLDDGDALDRVALLGLLRHVEAVGDFAEERVTPVEVRLSSGNVAGPVVHASGGSGQALGIVADVGLFLNLLARELA